MTHFQTRTCNMSIMELNACIFCGATSEEEALIKCDYSCILDFEDPNQHEINSEEDIIL